MVQCLRLWASTAGYVGLILDGETKVPAWHIHHPQKKEEKDLQVYKIMAVAELGIIAVILYHSSELSPEIRGKLWAHLEIASSDESVFFLLAPAGEISKKGSVCLTWVPVLLWTNPCGPHMGRWLGGGLVVGQTEQFRLWLTLTFLNIFIKLIVRTSL